MSAGPGWLDQLRTSLSQPGLTEFWRAGLNRGSYPGIDSAGCVFGGCKAASIWRLVTGDLSEHIARLNYCDQHAIMVAYARSLPCTSCGKQMRVEVREKMIL